MLTFARSSSPVGDAELRAKGREMNALLELAHKFMLQSMRAQILEEFSSPLSSREIEILRWAADGKTGKDIAQILGISLATVRFHTAKSITKLHAPNLQSAIARALMLDVLQDAR
jgi:LuxR family transcriptional regulator